MSAQEDPKQLAAFLALISSVLQNERALRADSDEQAEQNAELLDSLRERQVLLERLAQLQRGIVDRLPVHEVLEAVVEGACELLDSSVGNPLDRRSRTIRTMRRQWPLSGGTRS